MAKKIIGNPTVTPMAVPDFAQTDERKADYIKNKHYIVEIIRANAQQYINEDTTLPPSVQCMVDYVNSMPYGGDIEYLRSELYDNYVSNDELNDKVARTDNYIRHDMRIENLELANGDIETALDNIIAIQNSLIGGGSV